MTCTGTGTAAAVMAVTTSCRSSYHCRSRCQCLAARPTLGTWQRVVVDTNAATGPEGAAELPPALTLMFGSVTLFETDRVAQSGHRFLEIAVLDRARGHQRGERLGDDVELFLRGLGAAAPGVLQQSDQQ